VRNDFFGERTAVERACSDAIAAIAAARDPSYANGRVASPDRDAVARLSCADLYVGSCHRAWADLASRIADDGIATVIDRCAAVYCEDLPAPKPVACRDRAAPRDLAMLAELDHAMLVHDGTPDGLATAIAQRVRWITGSPAVPPPDQIMLITVSKTTTTVMGSDLTTAQLAEAVAGAVKASPTTRFVIEADKDVPYARVVEIIDAIKAAGGAQIELSAK
jgi:biopolymer transport protein ExbD